MTSSMWLRFPCWHMYNLVLIDSTFQFSCMSKQKHTAIPFRSVFSSIVNLFLLSSTDWDSVYDICMSSSFSKDRSTKNVGWLIGGYVHCFMNQVILFYFVLYRCGFSFLFCFVFTKEKWKETNNVLLEPRSIVVNACHFAYPSSTMGSSNSLQLTTLVPEATAKN